MEGRILAVQLATRPKLAQGLALGGGAPVRDDLEVWRELFKLLLPVVQGRRRRDDEEGAPDVVPFS